ncbi:MAG: hypothetical protein M1450_00915 [Patescibacteria group bacterium]|nr:hypothetical protein [Patescibacteria group bacterium]
MKIKEWLKKIADEIRTNRWIQLGLGIVALAILGLVIASFVLNTISVSRKPGAPPSPTVTFPKPNTPQGGKNEVRIGKEVVGFVNRTYTNEKGNFCVEFSSEKSPGGIKIYEFAGPPPEGQQVVPNTHNDITYTNEMRIIKVIQPDP